MTAQKTKAPKKIKLEKEVDNVFVRECSFKDNVMLAELSANTGFKSNAKNVMLASYRYLEQLKQIADLENSLRALNEAKELMEKQLTKRISSKDAANDRLLEKLGAFQSDFKGYKKQVAMFIQSDAKKMCAIAEKVLKESAGLNKVTVNLRKGLNKISK